MSFRVKIDYIIVCKILETFTEGNPKYSRKNVKIRPFRNRHVAMETPKIYKIY